MRDSQAYHVEWFITRQAQCDVTVRITNGRLCSVEPGRSSDAIELGSVALIDGLVNVHTHLEFSSFECPIPTNGRFTDWIRAVVAHRRASQVGVGQAIRLGVQESIATGTTALGEIATSGWQWSDYAPLLGDSVVFQELLGLLPERVAQQKKLAASHLENALAANGFGISPHAPYSTHLELVRYAVERACQCDCPVAMHLAETPAEIELLASGGGEFREMLTEFGIWNDDPTRFGNRPMDYLMILADAPRSLIIHGNYLNDDELSFLAARPRMTLVYCPRTHAAFRHDENPWLRAMELGVNVTLGTDSRASNPDLSLFAELQFLAAKTPGLSHLELLKMGSSSGRKGLGFEDSDNANFTLIRFGSGSMREPDSQLFAPTSQVCGTMITGRWASIAQSFREQLDF